ncbi:hypothetical protein DH2020_043513 [Rehmannia glutinosa]|uniref:TRAF-type domain-containing protein n=1 Tax=Rehmannia glutinosa TaxID=99300 RepID=A0ABR0UL94_REHGL
MDPPADDIELKPEKLGEEKEGGPLFHCDFYDMDIVYKVGQALLPGLASACIDNTIGGIFKTPASVAVDIRREMVDYLIQRSENFVAESVVLEGGPDVEVSVDPHDIISDFVDDFVSSKRNFFSRVSGWILSEKREDWIDDLVQEMEINGFWLLNRRNSVAQTLLKNLDFKNIYHCSMSFKTLEDLGKHKSHCSFRTMTCQNEGCDSSFSAAQMDHHDSICPFKILPCEQNCPDSIMRREMDRHCITICPMKLVKCPFYSVGCQSTIPQCTIEQHRSDSLPSHLLYILQVFHKEASVEDLKERSKELEKLSSPGQLASARDARSLTTVIKNLEKKLGPLKINTNSKLNEEVPDSIEKKEEKTGMPNKHVRFENPPGEKEETANSHSKVSEHEYSIHEKGELMESSTIVSTQSQTNEKEVVASISVQENLKESPFQREDDLGSPTEVDAQMGTLSKEETLKESPFQKEEDLGSPTKVDTQIGKLSKEEVVDPIKEERSASTIKPEKLTDSDAEREKHAKSPARNEVSTKSPHGREFLISSDREVGKESIPGKEQTDSLNLSAPGVEDVKS